MAAQNGLASSTAGGGRSFHPAPGTRRSELPLRRGGRPFRILVAEDEAVAAMDIQNIVSGFGGDVVGIARRGQEAIELAERHHPDLVLMDVHLIGELDGVESARVIRNRLGVAVVFVTAHGDPDTLRRMFEVVPLAPVIKPISETRLRDAILRACPP